jgi:imidazolonepropionase-like amidohydrolase
MSTTMSSSQLTIHTALLFDPRTKQFERNVSIVVDQETGLIADVYRRSDSRPPHISPHDIDLRFLVVFPGFVDAHTHIFLHAFSETPSINQMRDENFAERVIRAVNHCRKALLAGYTSYRDLGTEGLQDADVNVRDAVNRGLTPGPRLFVATEAIASSGGYAIRQENRLPGVGTTVPSISDVADGIDGVRAAVRRRIGAGADVVKFYADYRKRQLRFPPPQWKGALPIQFPPQYPNPNVTLFTQEEMNAIVTEANAANCPVAAHAGAPEAVIMAAKAGVTTIEHGNELGVEALQAMKEAGTIFVPTLAILEQLIPDDDMGKILAHTKKAWEMGIKLACGGDTGAFPHGDNAREMELMVQAGVPLEEVLTAATLHGWEACGGDRCGRKFGWFEKGVAADIIALDGDPRSDVGALRKVQFVMKDGRVWKRDGVAVGMV